VKFDGIICTDWLPYSAWPNCANAGADVMGGADPGAVGFSMGTFISQVGETRINEAVKRILTAKIKLGLFENPYGDPVNGPKTWFTPEHQNIAIDAARQSMTLLKNTGVLPISLASGSNLLVTGSRANDGSSYCVWTSYFHKDAGAKTMYEAIKEKAATKGINTFLDNATNPAAAIVCIGEPSYTHGTAWDKNMPYVHDAYFPVQNTYEYDSTTLARVRALNIPYVVVMILPRPYVLTNVVNNANAVLLAYRPGDGGDPALAQVLFGDYAPKGKLPWQLPASMSQVGTDDPLNALERWDLPFDLGATAAERQDIRAKIAAGIQPQPIYGTPLYQYGYGIQGYGKAAVLEENITNIENVVSSSNDMVVLYPNPSTGIVNIKFNGTDQQWNVQVFDISGKMVIESNIISSNSISTINLENISKGIYTIRLSNNSTSLFKKIVKN
jgi:beta-glucosidase